MAQAEPTKVVLEITEGLAGYFNWAMYHCPISSQIDCLPQYLVESGIILKRKLNTLLRAFVANDCNFLVKWKGEIACWAWHFQDLLDRRELAGYNDDTYTVEPTEGDWTDSDTE